MKTHMPHKKKKKTSGSKYFSPFNSFFFLLEITGVCCLISFRVSQAAVLLSPTPGDDAEVTAAADGEHGGILTHSHSAGDKRIGGGCGGRGGRGKGGEGGTWVKLGGDVWVGGTQQERHRLDRHVLPGRRHWRETRRRLRSSAQTPPLECLTPASRPEGEEVRQFPRLFA